MGKYYRILVCVNREITMRRKKGLIPVQYVHFQLDFIVNTESSSGGLTYNKIFWYKKSPETGNKMVNGVGDKKETPEGLDRRDVIEIFKYKKYKNMQETIKIT